MRLILASALFWTGTHLCLMSQAECDGHSQARAKAPCHGQASDQGHCCRGVHLTEAGVPSGQSLALAPRGPHPAGLISSAAAPVLVTRTVLTPQTYAVGPPHSPPPRESFGRSPPTA